MDTGLGAKAYAIIEQGKIGLILSSRPTDRRQLIEEAAGITKYKARRRAAELKLEAAQQNLTRIDDIVFEVEKQRGSLKRQAAKARRYTRLRDEMRRWEKVLFARRYRIARRGDRVGARRGWPRRASRRRARRRAWRRSKTSSGALRIELAEAEAAATACARGRARPRARDESPAAADRARHAAGRHAARRAATSSRSSGRRSTARREPERLALEERRAAALEAERARDESAATAELRPPSTRRRSRRIEAAEQEVERARAEVYAVMNTVTALTAALEAADGAARARGRGARPARDRGVGPAHRARSRRRRARGGQRRPGARARSASTRRRLARAARESELASARIEHEWRAREVRSREHELAALTARLRSLEELDAHRAGFSDAARMVLVQANGRVGQMGALADVIEVEPRYERAVEACLGELLQHVLVQRHEHAAAGLALVRQEDAGRCGFVVRRNPAARPGRQKPTSARVDDR